MEMSSNEASNPPFPSLYPSALYADTSNVMRSVLNAKASRRDEELKQQNQLP